MKLTKQILPWEMLHKNTAPPNESFPSFDGMVSCDELQLYKNKDRTWAFCQRLRSDINGILPMLTAYNSLLNKSGVVTSCQGLPLYRFLPTDWSTLYSALKMV